MELAITVDVEEEGLFRGKYEQVPLGVANVRELSKLDFIPREFGFPLTLLVTYAVAKDKRACEVLASWRERNGAEIGAHLHPWNTPPFNNRPGSAEGGGESRGNLLLREKLVYLRGAIRDGLGVAPRSFRMGRFEVSPTILTLLREQKFQVDSSVVPLRQEIGGPDQFLSPPDPYWIQPSDLPEPPLLEVPLTSVPLWIRGPALIYRLSKFLPAGQGEWLRRIFSYVGAAGPQPTMFPLASMCHGTRLHRRRGGRVITLYLHSSELLPGASPQFPNEAAVQRLLRKLRRFLTWLVQTGPVTGVTLSRLYMKRVGSEP